MSEKVILMKLNLEISIGEHVEVHFSARVWELSHNFDTIQDKIKTIILSLKLAKELFEKS